MNLKKFKRDELERYCRELQFQQKQLTESRDFWKKQYYKAEEIIRDHQQAIEEIDDEHA